MSWKCKIGFHDYVNIGHQTVSGLVSSFSMTQLRRDVNECTKCGKIKFVGYDISTTSHKDETLNWQPKIPTLARKRKLKIKKLLNNIK